GGPSWGSQSIPLILSGPGIRRAYQSAFPARLVAVAPTSMRLLGVPYPPLDGIVRADALSKPSTAEHVALGQISRQVTPVAAALRRQSVLDVEYLMTHTPVNPPSNLGTGSGNPSHTKTQPSPPLAPSY